LRQKVDGNQLAGEAGKQGLRLASIDRNIVYRMVVTRWSRMKSGRPNESLEPAARH
jgi:hypothetical protein